MPLFGKTRFTGRNTQRAQFVDREEQQVSQVVPPSTYRFVNRDPLDELLAPEQSFNVTEFETDLSGLEGEFEVPDLLGSVEAIDFNVPTITPEQFTPNSATSPDGTTVEVNGSGKVSVGGSGLNSKTQPRPDQVAAVSAWANAIYAANPSLIRGRQFGASNFYGHPEGMALDIMVSRPGTLPTDANHQIGARLAAWAAVNTGRGKPFDLTLYRNSNPSTRGITAAHYDHVHISFSQAWNGPYPPPPRF